MAAEAPLESQLATKSHKTVNVSQSLLQPSSKRKILLSALDAFPWIRTSCMKLDVSFEATYRATWICHKLEVMGFQTGHFLQAIAAIIFLACKCSDQLRPPRDVLNCLHAVHQGDSHVIPLGSTYRTLKHGLIAREALILRCLHFDAGMNEVPPHSFALRALQLLRVHSAHAQTVISTLNDITPRLVSLPAADAGAAVCIAVLGALHWASSARQPQAAAGKAANGGDANLPAHLGALKEQWPADFCVGAVWGAVVASGASSDGIEKALPLVSQHIRGVWQANHDRFGSDSAVDALEDLCQAAWQEPAQPVDQSKNTEVG